jgi:hypothetical protein
MSESRARACRKDVEDLAAAQRETGQRAPVCSHDGKPCSNSEGPCQAVAGGTGLDNSVLWRCPRFPPGGSGDKVTMFFGVGKRKGKAT